ncbi:hypothetical protein RFI_09063 [Reticulomyxa filosa]|uniref:Prolyl 4-hydroxylase alpha subunit domain-containing protein n=1 Tax=Reticulomyxa filosa TaxID=46433 RepID=X6NQ73_RETFI|nr:hypothetical protein RFI_09063 [Reticulomyxa filosa]|eukprot:ETO28068.1 hypothetical protein RFI_09063 [Reticulomyxa filosa]
MLFFAFLFILLRFCFENVAALAVSIEPDGIANEIENEENVNPESGTTELEFEISVRNWRGNTISVWELLAVDPEQGKDDAIAKFLLTIPSDHDGSIRLVPGTRLGLSTGTSKAPDVNLFNSVFVYPYMKEVHVLPAETQMRLQSDDARYIERYHKFAKKYWQIHNQERHWINFFPSYKPIHHIHKTLHKPKESFNPTKTQVLFSNASYYYDKNDTPVEITMKSLCDKPRLFHLSNVLNDLECNMLSYLAASNNYIPLYKSEKKDEVAHHTWLSPNTYALVHRLYERFADVLKINTSMLFKSAEDLRIVRYKAPNGRLRRSFDYVRPLSPKNRLLTLVVFLNTMGEEFTGGRSHFPASQCNAKVSPKKGDAVLLYNMLPDGNLDELALRSSLKVTNGTQWVAVLWVWNPEK